MPEFEAVFNPDWKSFVDGELAHSNELNNRALGGRQRSNSDDDDDMSGRHDEDMEKIMNRFNIVNNLISKSNDDDDDKDDDDKQEDEPENEDSPVLEEKSSSRTDMSMLHIEVTLPDGLPLERKMTDTEYFKTDHLD